MKKRYSIYIKPISIIANLVFINFTLYYFFREDFLNYWNVIYVNVTWLTISYFLSFYALKRYNKNIDVLSRLFFQFLIFTFVYFAYFTLTSQPINTIKHLKTLGVIFIVIGSFRVFYLKMLKTYRYSGKNLRNVIIVGTNKNAQNISDFFYRHKELGYKILGYFSNKDPNSENYLGRVENCFDYALNNDVDEIYCSVSELSKEQIKAFIDFADNNLKVLKLIPESKNDFRNKMKVEYYDYTPILSLRTIPFHVPSNKIIKRAFDLTFSFLIIIFVLSWLSPLLFVIIKLESNGSLFFKQKRNGLNGITFTCYKFRSMSVNDNVDDIKTRQYGRITKIGKFIRKTSIDELPQFFNVFKGDMSVVGPRPHMLSYTELYAKTVDKYMVRHFVKPGITGLAQVKGYRGEVEKQGDIENRVKMDIFYIENWSFLLDMKIIGQTITNVFKGEQKAY